MFLNFNSELDEKLAYKYEDEDNVSYMLVNEHVENKK